MRERVVLSFDSFSQDITIMKHKGFIMTLGPTKTLVSCMTLGLASFEGWLSWLFTWLALEKMQLKFRNGRQE